MNAGNKSSWSWAARLVGEIVDSGNFSTLAPEHMDRLLAWLAGIEGPSSDLITAEFSARSLDKTEAKRLALSALDEYLFEDDQSNPLSVLGLNDGSDQETIKHRYRRLMQVYHPDRAIVHGEWLTSRAETINQAYSRLSRNGRSRQHESAVVPAAQIARPSYGAEVGEGVYPAAQGRFHLRKSLGSAQKFERGVLGALAVLSVLVLGLMYISSREGGVAPAEAPRVDLVTKSNPGTGLDGSGQAETDSPGQNSTSSAPADVGSSAAAEQSEPAVEKEVAVHAEGGVEEVAAETRDANRELEQKSAGLESATLPEEKEEKVGNKIVAKATRQVRAIDPEQGAAAAHAEIAKKPDSVKERPVSSSVKPATVQKNMKQTAPGGIEPRGKPPKAQGPELASKRKAEPKQTSLQPARHAPELPEVPVVSDSRRSRPKKPEKTAKDPDQIGTPVGPSEVASKLKNQGKIAVKSVPTKETVEEPVVRTVEVSKDESWPDYAVWPDHQRKPTTMERVVAKGALVRYVDGIVEGDLSKLSSSIGQEVIVDGTRKSRGRLVTEYQMLFRNTSKRKYDFHIKSWRDIGNGTIKVEGDADIRYQYHSSPDRVFKGKQAYYLVKKGLGAKLVKIMQE